MKESTRIKLTHRYGMAAILVVALGLGGTLWLSNHRLADDFQENATQRDEAIRQRAQSEAPLGTKILANYASSSQSPQQDLTDLSHAFGNYALLVKGSDPLSLGANEDLANALRGKNRTQFKFLPEDAPCFNARGQLIDRWQSPLFFHANDQQRVDIRSAGPDKQMWTEDDLHRRYDGQFIEGEELNAASLFDATKDYRP